MAYILSFGEPNPDFNDTFETSFTVIPEPACTALLALGSLGLRRRTFRS